MYAIWTIEFRIQFLPPLEICLGDQQYIALLYLDDICVSQPKIDKMSHYNRFIHNFSALAKHLYQLIDLTNSKNSKKGPR